MAVPRSPTTDGKEVEISSVASSSFHQITKYLDSFRIHSDRKSIQLLRREAIIMRFLNQSSASQFGIAAVVFLDFLPAAGCNKGSDTTTSPAGASERKLCSCRKTGIRFE